MFLIEGHTDAVGTEEDNLSLSDRRAEAVAVALTEQFQIPPENLTTQGYGEQQLKVPVQGPDEAEPPRHGAPHHAAAGGKAVDNNKDIKAGLSQDGSASFLLNSITAA